MLNKKAPQSEPRGNKHHTQIIPERLLNVKQAAAYLGVSERTLYSYTTQYGGSIPLVKLSPRCNKIDLADLEAFIQSRKRGAL